MKNVQPIKKNIYFALNLLFEYIKNQTKNTVL